jgi:hypothetical protein
MTFLCGTAFACQREPPLPTEYKTGITQNANLTLHMRKISGCPGILLKIGWTPLGPLTLFTFCDVFELAALEKGLHFDIPAAGTKKFLCSSGCTGVFTCLTHGYTPCQKAFIGGFPKTPEISIPSLLWTGENCQ